MQEIYFELSGIGIYNILCRATVKSIMSMASESSFIERITDKLMSTEYAVDFYTISIAVMYLSCLYVDVRRKVRVFITESEEFRPILNNFNNAVLDYGLIESFLAQWSCIFENVLSKRGCV